jgi:hypothetical protein
MIVGLSGCAVAFHENKIASLNARMALLFIAMMTDRISIGCLGNGH